MTNRNSGIKHDEHKLPVHLLPFDALMAITEILQYGAKKYTRNFNNILEGYWNIVKPTAVTLYTPKDFVVTVTKNNSEKITMTFQKDKEKILENGVVLTPINLENQSPIEIEELIQSYEKEIKDQKKEEIFLNLDSLKKVTKHLNWQDALSAVQPNTYTLITTMKQGIFVEYYVVSTITVLDSLETTLQVLKEPYNISKTVNLLEETGERNWEMGMDWHRPFRACLTHLWKWWMKIDDGKGPGMDEETGKSHLLHAGCCVLFMISYELRNIGKDTRP